MTERSSQYGLTPGYVAGLIDGEGWIGLTRTGSPLIEVEMCDHGAVTSLWETFHAGTVRFRPSRGPARRASYRWRVSGAAARAVLAYCLDELVVKRPHALAAARSDRARLRRLNSRGTST